MTTERCNDFVRRAFMNISNLQSEIDKFAFAAEDDHIVFSAACEGAIKDIFTKFARFWGSAGDAWLISPASAIYDEVRELLPMELRKDLDQFITEKEAEAKAFQNEKAAKRKGAK